MSFQKMSARANEVRQLFGAKEIKKWTREDVMMGFVGDVGDLAKLVMAQEGLRQIEDKDGKLKHELADCLWSLLVLAKEYGVDIEQEFYKTMDSIEEKLSK